MSYQKESNNLNTSDSSFNTCVSRKMSLIELSEEEQLNYALKMSEETELRRV